MYGMELKETVQYFKKCEFETIITKIEIDKATLSLILNTLVLKC